MSQARADGPLFSADVAGRAFDEIDGRDDVYDFDDLQDSEDLDDDTPFLDESSDTTDHSYARISAENSAARRIVKRALIMAFTVYAFAALASWIAVNDAPAGVVHNLEPRNLGMLADALTTIVGLGLFSAFYEMVGLMARRWLRIVYTALMWLIFTGAIIMFEFERSVAVVETNTEFVFVRPWPVQPIALGKGTIIDIITRDTGAVITLRIIGHPYKPVTVRPAWKLDAGARAEQAALIASLQRNRM